MKCVLCNKEIPAGKEILCQNCLAKPASVRALQLLDYLNRKPKMTVYQYGEPKGDN